MQTWKNSVVLRLQQSTFDEELSSNTSVLANYWNLKKPHLAVRERGEDDDNPHQHWFFHLQDGKKLSSLRRALNLKRIKGNEMYAMKAGKPKLVDGHFDYLCKGITSQKEDNVDIIQRSEDFTDAVIAQRHEIYHKIADYLPDKKRKLEVNAAKMIGELEVSMRKKPRIPHNRADLVKLAMRWYYENKTSINVHHLRTVTNHVSYGIANEDNLILCEETAEHADYVNKMEQSILNNTE